MDIVYHVLTACWQVTGQMAPYLLFGFLVAGILSLLISAEWVRRHLGGGGLWSVVKASLFGVPLPLCSCSVLPVSMSLRAQGASRPATTSFLVSTPQTGVDSILATYGLLGPVFAVLRPVVAFFAGILGGVLVYFIDPDTPQTASFSSDSKEGAAAACSSEKKTDSCCGSSCGCSGGAVVSGEKAEEKSGCPVCRALWHGFVVLPSSIGGAMLIGIIVAGVVSAFVPKDYFATSLGGGLPAMLAMVAVGIPIYVCSTASIPLALGLMHMGVSPGAAFVFLIAGPATNAAGFTTIWKGLGKKSALAYLFTVFVSAIVSGLILDGLVGAGYSLHLPMASHEHGMETGMWPSIWATLLLAVLAGSKFLAGRSRSGADSSDVIPEVQEDGAMVVLKITGMSCGHCTAAVQKALEQCEGVESVSVDLKSGRAIVKGKVKNPALLVDVVGQLGYDSKLEPVENA